MPYKIVRTDMGNMGSLNSDTLSEALETKVQALIKKGWVCTGGVCVVAHDSYPMYMYQAMVKK